MNNENLLLTLVILGIGALIGVSMIIPNTSQRSPYGPTRGNGSKTFSRSFFIGMLFPIMVFLLLGGFGYAVCTKGYCTVGNILPLLSGLGVLWISFILIKLITPLFIGKSASLDASYEKITSNKRSIRIKNLTKYISYALLLSLLLFSLLFVNIDELVNGVKEYCWNLGISAKIIENIHFKSIVARCFYILNISALIGTISTLKMIANDANLRGNEYIQERKLRDLEAKMKKY